MYKLIDECIYGKEGIPNSIKEQFKRLKDDETLIEGMDLGQGVSTQRRVRDYARTSVIPDFQADLLYRLMKHFEPTSVLELGTNLGKSSLSFLAASNDIQLTTVEGNKAVHDFATQNVLPASVNSIHSSFDEFFASNDSKFDLVFIDGDHNLDPTMKYFNAIKPILNPGGLLIFHDIYWSAGMKEAWSKIKADLDVTVTVDLFFMGLVWLDRNQEKQDFSVKFPERMRQLL